MASALVSVLDFLSVTNNMRSIDGQKLAQIRSRNTQACRKSSVDEKTLRNIAHELHLLDDTINLQHLEICLIENDDVTLKQKLTLIFSENSTVSNQANKRQAKVEKKTINETELLSQITCYIHVKQNRASVEEFIQQFLLRPLIHQQYNHNW